MTARAVVFDGAGVILRVVSGPASMMAQQAGAGESLLVVTGDDGGVIDDANLVVTSGELAAAEGYGGAVPDYGLVAL